MIASTHSPSRLLFSSPSSWRICLTHIGMVLVFTVAGCAQTQGIVREASIRFGGGPINCKPITQPLVRISGPRAGKDLVPHTNAPDASRGMLKSPSGPELYVVSRPDLQGLYAVWEPAARTKDTELLDFLTLVLLKDISELAHFATEACNHYQQGVTVGLKPHLESQVALSKLAEDSVRWFNRVLTDPSGYQLVRQVQSSRGTIFALLRAAPGGDLASVRAIKTLASLTARDKGAQEAIALAKRFYAESALARQRVDRMMRDTTEAELLLRPGVYTPDDVYRIGQREGLGEVVAGVAIMGAVI